MSQMRIKPASDSPNSPTWRDRAALIEEELEQVLAQKEELENRLAEIASIAAPEEVERAERIDASLTILQEEQQRMRAMLERIEERLPGPVLGEN